MIAPDVTIELWATADGVNVVAEFGDPRERAARLRGERARE
jgi:hypothetical protein